MTSRLSTFPPARSPNPAQHVFSFRQLTLHACALGTLLLAASSCESPTSPDDSHTLTIDGTNARSGPVTATDTVVYELRVDAGARFAI